MIRSFGKRSIHVEIQLFVLSVYRDHSPLFVSIVYVTILVIRKKYDRKYSLTDCVTNLKIYPADSIRRELLAYYLQRNGRKALSPIWRQANFPPMVTCTRSPGKKGNGGRE